MSKSTCTEADCERPHLAKGMCKMHYYRANRKPEPTRYVPRTCTECGIDYQGSRGALTTTCPPCAKVVSIQKRLATLAHIRAGREEAKALIPKPKYRRVCEMCASEYEAEHNLPSKYCSKSCAKEAGAVRAGCRDRKCRDCGVSLGYFSLVSLCEDCKAQSLRAARKAGKHRRRARIYAVEHETIKAAEIYERDGWRCGLCSGRVSKHHTYPHPMSASLDHIVPLSKGGTHTKDNTQLSHWSCNHQKGAKLQGQLLLFG